jgi:hypothetical protein
MIGALLLRLKLLNHDWRKYCEKKRKKEGDSSKSVLLLFFVVVA